MRKTGLFVAIEGLEGAGKSSAIATIQTQLQHQGISYLITREPGGTAIGEQLRQILKNTEYRATLDPRSELLMMYTSRIQLVEEVIKPALRAGTWVISDRFELSSLAYQGGGRQLDSEFIKRLSKFALQGFKPDMTLFLNIAAEQGMQRAVSRGALDRFEIEKIEFFHRIATAYQEVIAHDDTVKIINASLPFDQVQQEIALNINELIAQYG